MNIENNNFNSKFDHSKDSEFGIIQSKGTIYNARERTWKAGWKNEHNKEFNYLIFYCMDMYMKNIVRVYIFPKEEIIKRNGIKIYGETTYHWYDKYRVDEKPYNDAYHSLNKEDLKKILRI